MIQALMVSPGCSEKPPPKADKRGLGTENGTGDEGRGEDALREKNEKQKEIENEFFRIRELETE